MNPTLYLHVGKHKTGTTSIQKYIFENAAFFSDNGYWVVNDSVCAMPEFIHENILPANCFVLAHILLRANLMTPMRIRGHAPRMNLKEQSDIATRINSVLKEQAQSHNKNALIISAEAFAFLRAPEERFLFDLMFKDFNVKPILFLREPNVWLKSWEKQVEPLSRLYQTHNPEDVKDTIFDFSGDSWLVDDVALQNFFLPDTCVLSYEVVCSQWGSVIPAFLNELGLNLTKCPDWNSFWENRTVDKILIKS